MSLIYLAGYYADAIRRATLSASSEHTEHPASRAGNGDQSAPFRWNAAAANVWLKADLNFMLNGGFEDAWIESDRPPHWTPDDGAGTLNEETSVTDTGSKALNINGVKEAYLDLVVIPGKKHRFDLAIRGDGTNYAYVYVQDLDTLKWLNNSNVWGVAKVNCAVRLTATYQDYFRVFTVEAPSIRRSYTRIRVTCASLASGDAYFDSFAIYPEVTFASIHAHNIPNAATVKLQHDSTGAFTGAETDAATFTVRPRSFYDTFTAFLVRYVRLLLVEETGLTPYLGALSLGHYNTLAQIYNWGPKTSLMQPQVRGQTPSGRLISKRRTSDPHRRYELSFMANTEAASDEVFRDMSDASDWGDEPLVVVPDTDDNEGVVLQARVENIFSYITNPMTTWDYGAILTEDPYPVEFNF